MVALKEEEDQLDILEANIVAAQQAAADAVDTDSVVTGTSVAGDLESVDTKSVTRAEDAALQNEDEEDYEVSAQDEEYRDIINEDLKKMRESRQMNVEAEDSLEQDLKMSPENSDDEHEGHNRQWNTSKSEQMLNLSGSDSGSNEDAQGKLSSFSDLVQFGTTTSTVVQSDGITFNYDENAQDFLASAYLMSADAVTDIGDDEAMRQAAAEFAAGNADDSDYEDGNFDPQAFFSSIGTGLQQNVQGGEENEMGANARSEADLHTDLQVSDSDSDDNNNDNDDDGDDDDDDFIAVDDNEDSNQDFDMKEFLK